MASGAGARLTMKLDEGNLRPYLKQMEKRGMDLRPYWKRLGTWMAFRSVDKTFKQRGRPKKWKQCGPFTIAMRRWQAKSPKASPHRAFTTKILEVTGALRGSFTFRARPKQLDVGTAHKSADVHQFGKTIRAPRRWKRTTVKVPKRQLIAIHPEDEKMAVTLAVRYLERG